MAIGSRLPSTSILAAPQSPSPMGVVTANQIKLTFDFMGRAIEFVVKRAG